MGIKKALLATTTALLAFMAMPMTASADPVIDNGGAFTISSGTTMLRTPTFSIHCLNATGTGTFTSSTTGTIQFTAHGCKWPVFGTYCTTGGQPDGTVATTALTFHLKTTTSGKPAVLVTPNAGHFVSFGCNFLGSFVVSGNGIIAEITEPEYNASSETATFLFNETKAGVQTHTTVAGSETEYGLATSKFGGPSEPFSLLALQNLTFTEGPITLTEE